ncbi:MAG: glucose-1-phosphate cytidylyltransferase [Acidobacteria bacterium]|nr:glucose-1-phosphate cytidylyltransferase [Acidobacteriota bacterium]
MGELVTAPLNKDTPVIVLCGGQGTRIRDAAEHIPKPMLQIGGYPILWHIMRIYAAHGYRNFILALGYKSWVIKEYFLNYRAMTSDFALEFGAQASMRILDSREPPDWRIVFAETGEHTQTGRRVFLCQKYVETDEFMVTYGDGVADIDITRLHAFHRDHQRTATVTGVTPPGRFGSLVVDGPSVVAFNEHRHAGGGLVNGGFFVFNRAMFDVLGTAGDSMLETQPMNALVEADQLRMYRHTGFWEPMDTLREYQALNDLWQKGNAPWRVWE